MKKIILTILVFINLIPRFQNGDIHFLNASAVKAQYGCPINVGGNGNSGDGGFFTWVSNQLNNVTEFVEKVAKKISGWFDKKKTEAGGERFAQEISENSWDDNTDTEETDDYGDYTPQGDPSGANWDEMWDEMTSDPWFNINEFGDQEFNFLYNMQDFYQTYYNGGSTSTPNDPPNPKYYITVGLLPDRYYENDSIFVMKCKDTATLLLHNENPPYTLQSNNIDWKQNGVVRATNATRCQPDRTIGTSLIKVDSANVKTLTKNPYTLYEKPTVKFHVGDGYFGDYAFDDSSYKHSSITSVAKYQPGTQVVTINGDPNYVVPWFGVCHNLGNYLNLTVENLSPRAKKDPGFKVHFKPTNNQIQLDFQNELVMRYDELLAKKKVYVTATEWDANADSNKTVGKVVVTVESGDTIGLLNISCVRPVPKKVMFVYVNTGNGYQNTGQYAKQTIIDTLTYRSHRQIFREWHLDPTYNYLDTLNIPTEYNADTAHYNNSDYVGQRLKVAFAAHKGMYISQLNPGVNTSGPDPEKLHVVFVLDYPSTDGVAGVTDLGGVVSVLFLNAGAHTIKHEMGHILNLRHTFPDYKKDGTLDNINYNIPKHSTYNLMDYRVYNNEERNNLGFFQWVDVY